MPVVVGPGLELRLPDVGGVPGLPVAGVLPVVASVDPERCWRGGGHRSSSCSAAIAAPIAAVWAGVPASAPERQVAHTASRSGFGTWYQWGRHVSRPARIFCRQPPAGHRCAVVALPGPRPAGGCVVVFIC